MELLQLKYFCDAAISENFSKTAKRFEVPPSDISQSVRRLERELGIDLFVRKPNSISLNEKGRKFYKSISSALRALDDAVQSVCDVVERGKIKICINSNRRVVMEVIEKFKRTYPEVEIATTHFGDPTSDDFDMIIDARDDELKGYEKTLLISEGMQLAMASSSPFAHVEQIDVRDLSDEPFITLSERSSLYHMTKSICRDKGFSPRMAIQSDDPFYVRKCVELGLGLCFVPKFSWEGQFSDNVVLKDVEGYFRHTYVFTDPKKHATLCSGKFIEMLVDELREKGN
jgi:DNA-binding transcriptional LysR family regulator